MGNESLKFGKHLPGPFFTQWGSYETLERREKLKAKPPNHCLTAPLRPTQRHSQNQASLRSLKIHRKIMTLTKISAATWEQGKERGGRKGKARVRGGPERVALGYRGRGHGSGWQRSQEAPKRRDHNGSREEKKHLSLILRLELKMQIGLGINSLLKMSTWGVTLATVTPGNLGWLQTHCVHCPSHGEVRMWELQSSLHPLPHSLGGSLGDLSFYSLK